MQTLRLETAEVFEPLLHPARYKGAHGGRGSGKSVFFGDLLIAGVFLLIGFALIMIVYSIIYSIMGPPRYGPLDAPPVSGRGRSLRR